MKSAEWRPRIEQISRKGKEFQIAEDANYAKEIVAKRHSAERKGT